ncbi:MAG TPA: FHA domain-containing protein, partial [Kofleriaceae bacterium]|nr:FHA domain-containing protein [Kofleriaceae bacterium]
MGTSLLPGKVKEFRFHRYALRVVEGPDKGREHVSSSAAELSVGTADSNGLVLTDPTVSRHHFVLQVSPEGVLLRDLDSTNGTQVAGLRVHGAYLKSGVTIHLGITKLRYDELPEQLQESVSEDDHFGRALGRSLAMRRLFSLLPRIAPTDTTVLIEGETGTGKGVLAEAIHGASPRAQGPFIVVDCGSIPPSLIESELFGHERGAFTGATSARAGAFEAAAG